MIPTFGNFLDPTTNGSSLTGAQTGMSNVGPLSMGQPVAASSGINPTTNPAANIPGITGTNEANTPLGMNVGTAGMVLGGIQTLGSLWNSWQQNKLAREQMDFSKKAYKTNLRNQTQTYNTALEDRIRARHYTEGKGSGATDAYLKEHSL